MRITTRLIIHCILPMDGIDGEGRIKRMSPKGIKKKPSKSFNQDFPTAFYYNCLLYTSDAADEGLGVDNNNFTSVSFAQVKMIIEKQIEQSKEGE